ncbi:hypothetical protein VDGL01_12356 [Verticillium dahliae]
MHVRPLGSNRISTDLSLIYRELPLPLSRTALCLFKTSVENLDDSHKTEEPGAVEADEKSRRWSSRKDAGLATSMEKQLRKEDTK